MRPKAIHQFHSGSAYGDAVTNSMFLIRDFVHSCGLESKIFVEHIAPELDKDLDHFSAYSGDKANLLLYHHSQGHEQTRWLRALPDTKVLIYHNVTPEIFFPEHSEARWYAALGRRQLDDLREIFTGAVAVSNYNLQELTALGYRQAQVIPLLFDPEKAGRADWNRSLYAELASTFNLLFVGRLSEHKGQHDLIRAFAAFQRVHPCPSRLFLVGGESSPDYRNKLQGLVQSYGLYQQVHMPGLVSDQDLYAYYRAADLFICLSQHEGFCIPLIEAMGFNIPLVAYDAGAVSDTLQGSGILTKRKDPEYIAALCSLLARNRSLRSRLLTTYPQSLHSYSLPKAWRTFLAFLNQLGIEVDSDSVSDIPYPSVSKVRYQFEGPFDGSYSLSLVNRQTALALEKKYPEQVALYATDGAGDYHPDPAWMQAHPQVDTLYRRSRPAPRDRIVLRNLYPPRTLDARGRLNILSSYAWEETGFPVQDIERFNCSLDGATVVSSFVRKILVDNGLKVPVAVVPNGVEHILEQEPEPLKAPLAPGWRFVHISSCFPRKGADVLLQAFARAFQGRKDVSLIIKTFANEHNRIWDQVRDVQDEYPQVAKIQVIDQDLSPGQTRWLYSQCHCLVAPSRGEGFGLPMAEAMLMGLPVITTAYGGQTDFCTPETAWLIDYSFAPAKTHFGLCDSVWAEPDVDHLARLMGRVADSRPEVLRARTGPARKLICSEYTWAKAAWKLDRFLQTLESGPLPEPGPVKLGWISTWNCRCGIAAYSDYLVRHLDPADVTVRVLANETQDLISRDQEYVSRVWRDCSQSDLSFLRDCILDLELEAVMIQFNFGFFHLQALGQLIRQLKAHGVKVLMTLHAVQGIDRPDFKASLSWIASDLACCDRLFVHSVKDMGLLKQASLVDNVTLWPHGVHAAPGRARQEQGRTLACYGFLLPHKGIYELIQAVDILRSEFSDLKLLLVNALYPAPESEWYYHKCREVSQELGLDHSITFHPDFLPEEQSRQLLSRADLIVFPYQQTGESSSAAVRFGLAVDRPVLCTPLDIFSDVRDVVFTARGSDPRALAHSIEKLLKSPERMASLDDRRKKWLIEHDWSTLGPRLSGLIKACTHRSPTDCS